MMHEEYIAIESQSRKERRKKTLRGMHIRNRRKRKETKKKRQMKSQIRQKGTRSPC